MQNLKDGCVLSKEIGITVKKAADLSEWYTQAVTKAELADYAPVKGFIILRPYGYSIWERIKEHLDRNLKETGHANAYFPLLIPESYLKKEATHFKGFTPEVFWVTQSGENRAFGTTCYSPHIRDYSERCVFKMGTELARSSTSH